MQQKKLNKQHINNNSNLYKIVNYKLFLSIFILVVITVESDYSLIQSLNQLQSYKLDYLVNIKTIIGVNQTFKFVMPQLDSTIDLSNNTWRSFMILDQDVNFFQEVMENQNNSFKKQQGKGTKIIQQSKETAVKDKEDSIIDNKSSFLSNKTKTSSFTEKFNQIIQKQKKINNSKQSIGEFSENPFFCKYINPSIQISKIYNSIQQSSFNMYTYGSSSVLHQKIYLIIPTRSLIYSFNSEYSVIQAYHYNQRQIKLLSTLRLNLEMSMPFIVSMYAHSDGSHVYIFTQKAIIWIDTKTILTNIKYVKRLGKFYPGIKLSKVISISDDILVGMNTFQGLFVFKDQPQFYQNSNQLTQFQKKHNKKQRMKGVTAWKNVQFQTRDIFYQNQRLYVLSLRSGVFIFDLTLSINQNSTQLKLIQDHKIDFSTQQNGNFQLLVKQSSIFILFNQKDGTKMVQIYHNKKKQRGQLVRYYKINQFIKTIKLFKSQTTLTSNNQSKQNLLFLIADDDYLQVYPFNQDPRMITSLNNGIKIQINKIRNIFHVYGAKYIIITDDQIKYLKLNINKPQLSCITNPETYKGPGNYLISISNNVSSCQKFRPEEKALQYPHKIAYNSYCQLNEYYYITINDPDYNQFKKYLAYGVVGIFVVIFMIGLMILIQWRNNKLLVLQRLKDQIIRFRNRAKRMQPYVIQQQKSEDVEIQVPKLESLREEVDIPDLNDSK